MPGGAVTAPGAPVAGIVGKLPAHGDFVRRGQPAAVLARVDRWLDVELSAVVATGVALDDAVAALDGAGGAFAQDGGTVLVALIASGDSVGRRFPLAATLTGPHPDRAGGAAWCTAAAAALATARDSGGNADAALAVVAAIPTPAAADGVPATGWWRGGGSVADDPAIVEPTGGLADASPGSSPPGAADASIPPAPDGPAIPTTVLPAGPAFRALLADVRP